MKSGLLHTLHFNFIIIIRSHVERLLFRFILIAYRLIMEINEMGLKQYNELLVEIKEATDLLKENTSKIADANEVLVKLNDNVNYKWFSVFYLVFNMNYFLLLKIKNLDIQITAVNGTLKQTNKEVKLFQFKNRTENCWTCN